MEVSQAAARALLRLRPSLYSAPMQSPLASLSRRTLSTTSAARQDIISGFLSREEQKSKDAEAQRKADDEASRRSHAAATSPSLSPAIDKLLDDSLDFGSKGVPTVTENRPSHWASPHAQREHRVQPAAAAAAAAPNSFSDMISDFKTNRPQRNRQSGAMGSMVFDSLSGNMLARQPDKVDPLPFKPGPTLGRTVDVLQADVGRAFRTLDAQLGRNRVKADFNRNRFHERPGLKRKRLASARWRRRFKEAFRGTVKMVNNMRKQGW